MKIFGSGRVLAVFTAVFFAETVLAADLKLITGKDGRSTLAITGEILPGDAESFTTLVKQANEAGKFVANVRLNSQGGNLVEGVELAEAIRFGKMSTNVGKNATCASACFLMFAAGATKFATYGAQIGVHGASDGSGRETTSSNAATVSMARIAKELGVPAAIIGRMVVTPPSDMVWLSPQELQSMGVTMMGRPVQTPLDLSQSAGLDRNQQARQTPDQSRPNEPTSLLPERSNPQTTWEGFVNNVITLSAQQNGGKAQSLRNCQPELKICINAVMFNYKGMDAMIKVSRDMNDVIRRREFCTFNKSGDIRLCMDWDTKRQHRDMQDARGNWTMVADE